MAFDRIRGQEAAVDQLRAALASGRVSHAYLFHGPEGTGRSLAAFEFARAINCGADRPDAEGGYPGDACGACLSCRRMEHGTHPDFHVLDLGTKGGESVGIEQVRQLIGDVSLRPTAGRRKVYVIPAANRLSPPAAHTILKTLEEPPPYVTLILVTPEVSEMLPTVISRCQLVRFRPLPDEVLESLMVEQGVEESLAREVTHIAGGSVGRALELALAPEALERRRELFALLRHTLSAPWPQALRIAEDLQRLGAPPKSPRGAKAAASEENGDEAEPPRSTKFGLTDVLDQSAGWFRDLLALQSGAPVELLQNPDQASHLEKLAGHVPAGYLLEALDALQEARRVIDRNANPRLVLEVLVMQLLAARPTASPRSV